MMNIFYAIPIAINQLAVFNSSDYIVIRFKGYDTSNPNVCIF